MFTSKKALLLIGMLVFTGSLVACDPMTGKETAGEYVDDTAITSKVIAAIVGDSTLKKSEIKVATFQNVVQLSGWVDTNNDINHAGDVARAVKGVRSVRNNLIVR